MLRRRDRCGDQHGVRGTFAYTSLDPSYGRREQVVSNELRARAEPLDQHLPARPVVFGKAIFD